MSVESLLEQWAIWHATDTDVDIGYPSKTPGFSAGGIHSFEDLCDRADQAAMRAVDAAVSSLPHAQAAAVLMKYGICATVFRFPRGNYDQLLEDAMIALEIMLRRKGFL